MNDRINASEAVYGFAAWLTTRDEAVTMGATHDAAIVAQLVDEFCRRHNLPPVRDTHYPNNLVPEAKPAQETQDPPREVDSIAEAIADAKIQARDAENGFARSHRLGAGWQPIDTAPENEDYVLLFADGLVIGFLDILFGDEDGPKWRDIGGNELDPGPAYWMPLPEPPR